MSGKQQIKQLSSIGPNRTGIATSEDQAEEMVEGTRLFPPSSTGTKFADDTVRILYARDFARDGEYGLGSVPPPTGLRAAAKTVLEKIKGHRPTLMLDKLGERLAFERTGVRLYEGLVSKHEAFGGYAGGPTRAELVEILNDEHRHFSMLIEVIDGLGGDPTAMTPAADVVGTVSMGIVKVISDPRTTLVQGLEAILVAELADRDGWAVLVELGREIGGDELVAQFVRAEQTETEHLARVRNWIRAAYKPGTSQAAE